MDACRTHLTDSWFELPIIFHLKSNKTRFFHLNGQKEKRSIDCSNYTFKMFGKERKNFVVDLVNAKYVVLDGKMK